jgi:nucleoside-diphosphate-sugar epimerase
MRILVLGGTHHVGRAVVEAAVSQGHQVTTLNRGRSSTRTPPGVETRHADRRDVEATRQALGDDTWDLVVDTWSEEPCVVRDSARLLSGRVPLYAYVSSRSVYQWPFPREADESAPVVAGDPDSEEAQDYAAAKRGAELALEQEFDGTVVHARAGLILGPYEVVGRLPWWLQRIERGGRVPAPGPVDRPLQYVDARDLADWLVRTPELGLSGAYNTVSEPGHATIGQLLEACNEVTGRKAELVWVSPERVEAAGIQGWTELPIWTPPTGELARLHDCDVSRAMAAGLHCRPVGETVFDTWAWLQAEGAPPATSGRARALGISAEQEELLLG